MYLDRTFLRNGGCTGVNDAGATEVSLYMAASKQSAMIGFLPFDESDAPQRITESDS